MSVAKTRYSRQMRSPKSICSSIGSLAVPGLTRSMFVRGQKSSRPLLSTGPVRQAYRRHGVAGCRASECCVHPRVPRIGSVSDESLERQATTMKLAQKIGGIVVALIVVAVVALAIELAYTSTGMPAPPLPHDAAV